MRILLLVSLLTLSACNTWNGAGDDLAAGYKGAKNSVEGRDRDKQPSDYWNHDATRAHRYQSSVPNMQ